MPTITPALAIAISAWLLIIGYYTSALLLLTSGRLILFLFGVAMLALAVIL